MDRFGETKKIKNGKNYFITLTNSKTQLLGNSKLAVEDHLHFLKKMNANQLERSE